MLLWALRCEILASAISLWSAECASQGAVELASQFVDCRIFGERHGYCLLLRNLETEFIIGYFCRLLVELEESELPSYIHRNSCFTRV